MSVNKKYENSLDELNANENNLPSLDELTKQLQIRSSNDVSSNKQSFADASKNFVSSLTSNYGWKTWIIIILILALIGINVFYVIGRGSQFAGNVTQYLANIFNDIFGPLLKLLGLATLETTKQTIDLASTGTNAISSGIANTANKGINAIEDNAINKNSSMPSSYSSPVPLSNSTLSPLSPGQIGQTNSIPNNVSNTNYESINNNNLKQKLGQLKTDSLEKALKNAAQTPEVLPDDSQSNIQSGPQSGWCYIGSDKGTRACAQVGVNDGCMSGDIFPSQEICINPNLRA
jgi:hypothetical protein